MEWHYSDDRTQIILNEPTKRNRKISGHRFPMILGIDQYATEFAAFCEITGLARLPFETNKYVEFGKINESKMIDFARQKFPNVMSCEEYYGASWKDYQYSNYKDLGGIFDGVRDFVCTKNDKKTITLVGECKGSSHPEQWVSGSVPPSYFAQAALYTYLDKLDKMLFIATFPTPLEYGHPNEYVVTPENTIMTVKKLNEFIILLPNGLYGGIQDCIEYCEEWWERHIKTGISPKFDEKLDKEYLDIIRKSSPAKDNDLTTLCVAAITLAKEINELKVSSGLKSKEDQLKVLEGAIKTTMIEKNMDVCDKYTLKRTTKKVLDEKLLEQKYKKVYNECCVEKLTLTLSKNLKEEDGNEEN